MLLSSPAPQRLLFLLAPLALVWVAPAHCQTLDAPPDTNDSSPSSPEMKKGPAVEVEDETDPNALAVNFEIDTRSRYVFRGIALSEGFVLQPTLSLAKRGYTFSIFGNINASRKSGPLEGPRQLNEIDYTLSKSFQKGKITIEPGIVYYDYPTSTFDETGELTLSLSRPVGKATLFLNNNLDVLEYKGAYFGEFGVSHESALSNRTTGEVTVSLGFANRKFNRANIGPNRNALNVLGWGASLTYQINSKMYLRPHLNYTRILNSELRAALDEPNILEGSVALGFNF